MKQYKELLQNWETFEKLIQNINADKDNLTTALVKQYAEQNVEILNEVLCSSIEHLHRLEKVQSLNDIICMQARLRDDINKKIMQSTQQFFNVSLHHISDYNEWLKAHCDFATD